MRKSDLMAGSRNTDPQSSRDAAELVEATIRAQQTRAVYNEVFRRPGSTGAEIASWLGVERHIPSRRLPELRKAKLIMNGVDEADAKARMRKCRVVNKLSLTWWPKEKSAQKKLF